MAAKNEITGDTIQSRGTSAAYRDNYDLIFGKKKNDQTKLESDQTIEQDLNKDSNTLSDK